MATSCVILFLFAASVPADEGATLLARAAEAHGGIERFRAVSDWHIVAERKLSDPEVEEIYEEYLLRESGRERTLLIKRRAESILVFGHDGEAGFSLTDGSLRDDPGAADEGYYRAHGEYYLRSLPFKWMDPGVSVTYAGRESLGGRDVELLSISAAENVGPAWQDVWVGVFDRRTGLLVEARLTHHLDSGVSEITYHYDDYRSVSGLQIPHRLEYSTGGRRTGENVIQRIEIDAGVDPLLFSPESHRRP